VAAATATTTAAMIWIIDPRRSTLKQESPGRKPGVFRFDSGSVDNLRQEWIVALARKLRTW